MEVPPTHDGMSAGTAPLSKFWIEHRNYYLASFLLWREPTVWKWSHYRHHSDTIIVGRDPEIAFPRPSELKEFPLVFSHLVNGLKLFQRICIHAAGKIDTEVKITYQRRTQESDMGSKGIYANFGHLSSYCYLDGILYLSL